MPTLGTPTHHLPPCPPAIAIQAAATSRDDLEPCPLPPEWVLDGTPVARVLNLGKSADGLFSFGLWDCTAGKFQYVFGSDEVVHILAGEVTVEDGRSTYTLRAGDVGYFPAGLTAHWTVPRYVKKFAVHRTPRYTLIGRVRAKVGRLWRAVRA